MSWLAPLYFAGLAAVALPVIFHLIRRTPSGRMPFSSLMFLQASPPRFVKRRRLDQWPLLLLRGLILILLAFAFARPFLREQADQEQGEGEGVSIAVLVDTSASMRREGLWDDAVEQAEAALEAAPAGSRVGLFHFDQTLKVGLGAVELAALDPSAAKALFRERLAALSPGWGGSDLGRALIDLAELLSRQDDASTSACVVLVSDLQQGSRIRALESSQWPEGLHLELRRVKADAPNASLRAAPRAAESDDGELWVRIANGPDAEAEQFRLRWESADRARFEEEDSPVSYVPAGESRVVRAPSRPAGAEADRLVLLGDGVDFDNTWFDRPLPRRELSVVSLGFDGEGERGLDYYLERVFGEQGRESIGVVHDAAELDDPRRAPLAVWKLGAAGAASANSGLVNDPRPVVEALRRHADQGGVVLAVLTAAAGNGPALEALLGETSVTVDEVKPSRGYSLLGEIDFTHPLFGPFSDPRYRDFSQIRFWRHRRVGLPEGSEARAVASFEDGAPFLIERSHGAGRILVLTAGWHAADSNLARSTKFAPLLHGSLRLAPSLAPLQSHYAVGDRVPVGRWTHSSDAVIRDPSGAEHALAEGTAWFSQTNEPGLYTVVLDGSEEGFAVNLAADESRTAGLDPDELARRGVTLVADAAPTFDQDSTRQQQDSELEGGQNLWRWLVILAVVALLFETLWAGVLARRPPPSSGADAASTVKV